MVRIGIVGYGYWGPIITSCFQNAGYKIGAIADRHPERTCKILETSPDTRLYTDPQEIIDDSEIDALVICLPTSMHYDICKKALLCGTGRLDVRHCRGSVKPIRLLRRRL